MGSDINGLFDRSLSSEEACRRFFASCRKGGAWYPVHLNDAVHTAIFSPAGGGKTTGMVIPFLRQSRKSSGVILDPKGELYTATADTRRAMGHKVVCLDPFRVVTDKPDTYNPISSIDPASLLALDDCRSMANAIVIRTGEEKEPFWNDSAELHIAFTTAVTIAMASMENKSLQSGRIILTDQQKLQDAMQIAFDSPEMWGGMLARMAHQVAQYTDEKVRGSVLSTANTHCNFLDTPAVYDSTVRSSFDPEELLNGKMTIYLVLPAERCRSHAGLMRLWISSLLRVIVSAGVNQQHKVNFVCEEAATLGKLNVLEDALTLYRGYGVRLLLIYQSMGQLETCWGRGGCADSSFQHLIAGLLRMPGQDEL